MKINTRWSRLFYFHLRKRLRGLAWLGGHRCQLGCLANHGMAWRPTSKYIRATALNSGLIDQIKTSKHNITTTSPTILYYICGQLVWKMNSTIDKFKLLFEIGLSSWSLALTDKHWAHVLLILNTSNPSHGHYRWADMPSNPICLWCHTQKELSWVLYQFAENQYK